MKQIFYPVLTLLLPIQLVAQPTITKTENYAPGTVVRHAVCDTANVAGPGSAGGNQTWNFSSLVMTDSVTERIVLPSSSGFGVNFPDASYVKITNDGRYTFIQKTAAENYLVGSLDSATGTFTKYYDKAVYSQTPLVYLNSVSDIYTSVNTSVSADTSKGSIQASSDAWGTLVLPNGTYNNVMRVKIQIHQVDSLQIGPNKIAGVLNSTAYMWYDNQHYAPLMRWDSTHYDFGLGQANVKTITYLRNETYPLSVADLARSSVYSAFFSGDKLGLRGMINNGDEYTVSIFGMNGQRIACRKIIAASQLLEMQLAAEPAGGLYLVTVQDDQGNTEMIRVIK